MIPSLAGDSYPYEVAIVQFGVMLYSEVRDGIRGSFDALVEETQAIETAGFDYCVLIEHHQGDRGEFSAPLVWLAGLAARTSRLRLGVTVALLPLYHPVRLAEELTTIDVISGGRLFLGTGLGYQEKDFHAFGVPMSERLGRYRETLQILRAAWQSESITFHGKHFTIDDLRISPRPVQTRLDIWGGGMLEPAVVRVGGESDAWAAPSTTPIGRLHSLMQSYENAARAAGKQPRVFLNRNGWIDDSFAKARESYSQAILRHSQTLDGLSGSRSVLGSAFQDLPKEPLGDHQFILGSPEDCIRQVEAYRRSFPLLQGMSLRLRTPFGPDQPKVLRAIERFGREVLPALGD